MASLKKIIKNLESEFSINVHGKINKDVKIENVQYIFSHNIDSFIPDEKTIYVGNYQDLCLDNLDGIILLLNCRTNTINENGLHIYQDLNPLSVCNSIQNEIYKSHHINMKKEEIFQLLHAGYGMQSIIDSARTLLENHISICTTSFSMIATSPQNSSIRESFDNLGDKYYLKKNLLQNMIEKGIFTHLKNNKIPLIVQFNDAPNIEFLFYGIYIKQAIVGYICIRSTVRAITEDDETFIVDLSKLLSIEMQKDDFFTDKSGLKYEYFLTDLIERNFNSLELATLRLRQLGQVLHKYFWILSFSFSWSETNKLNPNYYINQLLSIFKNSMVFFYKGKLVMLLTSNHTNPFFNVDMDKLENFLSLNQIFVAISYRYENILDTYKYYNQTVHMLKNKSTYSNNRFYLYEENYLNHLFNSCEDKLSISSFIDPDIIFLSNYDKENNTEYIQTLKAFFLNNRNALQTSNYLHIHKSTFFYRLSKIKDLVNLDLENRAKLFSYEFSFYIIDYIKRWN